MRQSSLWNGSGPTFLCTHRTLDSGTLLVKNIDLDLEDRASHPGSLPLRLTS